MSLDGQNFWRGYASRPPMEATLLVLPTDPRNMLQFTHMCKAQVCLYCTCTCTQSVEQVKGRGFCTQTSFFSLAAILLTAVEFWKYKSILQEWLKEQIPGLCEVLCPEPLPYTSRNSFRVRHVYNSNPVLLRRVSFKSHCSSMIMWLQNWSVQ